MKKLTIILRNKKFKKMKQMEDNKNRSNIKKNITQMTSNLLSSHVLLSCFTVKPVGHTHS